MRSQHRLPSDDRFKVIEHLVGITQPADPGAATKAAAQPGTSFIAGGTTVTPTPDRRFYRHRAGYLLRLQVQFAQQGPQWAGNFAPLPNNEQIPGCTRVSDGNHYDVRNVQVRNEGWLNRNRFFIR
jgi:hypothetical protein